MTNRETIVITGSNGFIGMALKTKLDLMGHKVIKMAREYHRVDCDRIYHLGCPSATEELEKDPVSIMNIIINKTQEAVNICPKALFINASTMGVEIGSSDPGQNLYNNSKELMEHYLKIVIPKQRLYNYRIPSVYGEGMSMSGFMGKCLNKEAYRPVDGKKEYEIIHINNLVSSMAELSKLNSEKTTLGKIYEDFAIGDRNINE
jgi:nucleoside-diphosphate-sugar epimerase